MIQISFLYAAVLALIFVALSLRVVKGRFKNQISLGSGGVSALNIAIRTHGNFAEYVPLALILLFAVETLAYPSLVIHSLGALLVFARLSHIYGLAKKNSIHPGRPVGVVTTLLVISASAVLILLRSF